MSSLRCLSGCGRHLRFHFLLITVESQSVYRTNLLFDDGSTYLKISRRISEGILKNGGYVSSVVIVSGIDICFSTESLEYRSSRRIHMSSETAFEVGVTCIAIRSCFRLAGAR